MNNQVDIKGWFVFKYIYVNPLQKELDGAIQAIQVPTSLNFAAIKYFLRFQPIFEYASKNSVDHLLIDLTCNELLTNF